MLRLLLCLWTWGTYFWWVLAPSCQWLFRFLAFKSRTEPESHWKQPPGARAPLSVPPRVPSSVPPRVPPSVPPSVPPFMCPPSCASLHVPPLGVPCLVCAPLACPLSVPPFVCPPSCAPLCVPSLACPLGVPSFLQSRLDDWEAQLRCWG